MLLDGRQVQLPGYLGGRHAPLQVLLIGVDQDGGFAQLVSLQHGVQLFSDDAQSVPVHAVDDHDDELRVGVVSGPGGSEALLATQVPHDKVNVLPDDLFDVGADGRRSVDHLVHEELVEYGGLAGVVQAHHDYLVL